MSGEAPVHRAATWLGSARGTHTISTLITAPLFRVAIVLTDGRSQDNVTGPAEAARKLSITTFSIGVTDHVLASELEAIAGSPTRWFYVDKFKVR